MKGSMVRRGRNATFLFVIVLLLAAAAGFARAAEGTWNDFMRAASTGTALPLLGPIDEAGRSGWACKPERAAETRSLTDAGLTGETP